MSIIRLQTVFVLIWWHIITNNAATAQHDSTFYLSYDDLITGRYYFHQSYTTIHLQNQQADYTLHYFPNTSVAMGVGASYKWLTVNLSYDFGFIKPESEKGETTVIDLQLNAYRRKLNIDVLAKHYRGFYLFPGGTATSSDAFYVRPDLQVNLLGASFQHIFNHEQFSFRAAFLQNEWQKKSAGTFLLGFETFAGQIKTDSTIVPTAINRRVAARNQTRIQFLDAGPHVGYAYSLVIKENYFLSGSATGSLAYDINVFKDDQDNRSDHTFGPNVSLRVTFGYNSSRMALIVNLINHSIQLARTFDRQLILNTGFIRFNFVYRFELNPEEKEALDIIEQD